MQGQLHTWPWSDSSTGNSGSFTISSAEAVGGQAACGGYSIDGSVTTTYNVTHKYANINGKPGSQVKTTTLIEKLSNSVGVACSTVDASQVDQNDPSTESHKWHDDVFLQGISYKTVSGAIVKASLATRTEPRAFSALPVTATAMGAMVRVGTFHVSHKMHTP